MKPFFERHALHFECTGCGRCCIAGEGYHVYLAGGEAERIRGYLGVPARRFRRDYLEDTAAGEAVLASGRGGRCVFLDDGGRCRIYPVRPLQCSSYPFWPEVAGSRPGWLREARRCEGIGRGARVPPGRVRRGLRDACRDIIPAPRRRARKY